MRKIMIKKISLSVFIFMAFISQVFAGGSFRLDIELEPILNQQPLIKDLVLETFDIAESGWASRIGQQVNEKFGGRRIGPYHIKAKPKGYQGEYIFELIFHTEKIFLDKNGEPTNLINADIIKEKFISLEIKMIEECKKPKENP